jgi:hypothetical protein
MVALRKPWLVTHDAPPRTKLAHMRRSFSGFDSNPAGYRCLRAISANLSFNHCLKP